MRRQARSFRAAVGDEGRVFYGTKAFPNVALLRLLREEGLGADVASAGELAFARAAGLSGDELVVHGNNKDEAFLREAAGRGAPVVLDAPDEVELAAAAGVSEVLVRVTLGVDADTHEAVVTGHHGSKFGLPEDEAEALVARALALGLDVLGLHVHVGSQLPDFTAQAETIERLAAFAGALPGRARLGGAGGRPRRRLRHPAPPRRGGAGCDRAAGPRARPRTRPSRRWGLPAPAVWLEPGRSLVGRAGVTLYRVGAVKRLAERTWVAIDGGMSDNPRPQLYGARYTALSATRADELGTRRSASPECTASPGDVLIDDVALPSPASRRPARGAGDRRVHPRDELELQRRPAAGEPCWLARARRS